MAGKQDPVLEPNAPLPICNENKRQRLKMGLTASPKPQSRGAQQESVRLSAYLQISALISLAMWMLLLLPDFLSQRGWSSQKIGWAMGAYFSVYLLVQILAGHIADRYGNITTALIGACLGVLGCLNYLVALKWTDFIFLARTLHGSGAAMVTAGVVFHLMDSVPQHLKGRMLGYFGLPGFVMLAAGPSLAEFFQKFGGIGGTFLAILGIHGSMIWIIRQLPDSLQRQDLPSTPFFKGFKQNFSKLKSVLSFSFGFGFCFSVWQSFLAPALSPLGGGAVSLFGLGYGVGAVLTRMGISQFLETEQRRLAAVSTLMLYGVCLAALPQVSEVWQLGGLGIVIGMSHGIYYPALSAIAAERFQPTGTGTAMSLYISSSSLGMFVGPPVWGFVADRAGYGWIFAGAGAAIVAATLAFVASEWRAR
jgi:MFS family permease